jgi:hypothetical protein
MIAFTKEKIDFKEQGNMIPLSEHNSIKVTNHKEVKVNELNIIVFKKGQNAV